MAPMNAQTILEYDAALLGSDGHAYRARACGRQRTDGTWEGWLEFESVSDAAVVLRTARETTQPNLTDLDYWASGVSAVYLEGALSRALQPRPEVLVTSPAPPAFDGPAPDVDVDEEVTGPYRAGRTIVLDPFAVYGRSGEGILRAELSALAPWQLRDIALAYHIFADETASIALTKPELVDTIATAVVARAMAWAHG